MRSWLTRMTQPDPPAGNGTFGSETRRYRLASELAEAWFTASVHARWLPASQDSKEFVFAYLCRTGNEVTRRYSVLDAAEAGGALNGAFLQMRGQAIPGTGVRLGYADAALTVTDDDRDFAERKAGIDRRARLDSAELEATRERLTRLRDLFLQDSAMAGLWWSDGDRDRLLQLGDNPGRFENAVGLLTGAPGGRAEREEADKVADLIEDFLGGLGPAHRELLIGKLGEVFRSHRRQDLADELNYPMHPREESRE